MPHYHVLVSWQQAGSYRVAAESAREAVDKVEASGYPVGYPVEGSFKVEAVVNLDPNFSKDVEAHKSEFFAGELKNA